MGDLVDDPRFKDWAARDKNRAEFNRILEEQLLKADTEEWIGRFEAADVPAGAIKNIAEVAIDPQVLYNRMILTLAHPMGGEIKLVGNPVKMDGLSEEDYTAPPILNQH